MCIEILPCIRMITTRRLRETQKRRRKASAKPSHKPLLPHGNIKSYESIGQEDWKKRAVLQPEGWRVWQICKGCPSHPSEVVSATQSGNGQGLDDGCTTCVQLAGTRGEYEARVERQHPFLKSGEDPASPRQSTLQNTRGSKGASAFEAALPSPCPHFNELAIVIGQHAGCGQTLPHHARVYGKELEKEDGSTGHLGRWSSPWLSSDRRRTARTINSDPGRRTCLRLRTLGIITPIQTHCGRWGAGSRAGRCCIESKSKNSDKPQHYEARNL